MSGPRGPGRSLEPPAQRQVFADRPDPGVPLGVAGQWRRRVEVGLHARLLGIVEIKGVAKLVAGHTETLGFPIARYGHDLRRCGGAEAHGRPGLIALSNSGRRSLARSGRLSFGKNAW